MEVIDLEPASDCLAALIQAVPEGALGRPTPCTEYSVGDLLDHVHGLTIAFGRAAVKATGATATMGPAGDASRLPEDWRTAVPARVARLARAWREPSAWRGITRVGGQELPGEVAGTILFGELAVHGWDLAVATPLPYAPDRGGLSQLLALVTEVFGPGHEAARGAAFAPAVPVADSAPDFDRILGLLGRDPHWRP